jgi:hypothetical protein
LDVFLGTQKTCKSCKSAADHDNGTIS